MITIIIVLSSCIKVIMITEKMSRIAALCCVLSSAFAVEHLHQHQRRVGRIEDEEVAVVKAQEPSLLARLIGEETQARVCFQQHRSSVDIRVN